MSTDEFSMSQTIDPQPTGESLLRAVLDDCAAHSNRGTIYLPDEDTRVQSLIAYVTGLEGRVRADTEVIAQKDAGIATLKARQIPADMPFAPELDYLESCNRAVQDAWTQAIEHIGTPDLSLALQLVETAYKNRSLNHYELMRMVAHARQRRRNNE